MKRPEIVNSLRDILHRIAPDATTVLYGSEARGDARSDSDIDLLILVDKDLVTPEEKERIINPLFDLEFETGILINPFVIARQLWETRHKITPFYHNVMKEGIVL